MLLRAIPIKHLCVRCLTHYDALGVPRTATKADIKRAYLEKAKECHPDRNPDDKAAIQFQRIQEAHDVLMSSKLRAQYNHTLNQESYYGTQQTHRPPDGQPRRSNVRTHGTNTGKRNESFHENHRVNQDNYQQPGRQRSYYTDPYSASLEHSLTGKLHGIIVLGLGLTLVFVYGIYHLVTRIKDEVQEGRHKKSKSAAHYFAEAKRKMSLTNMWDKFSVSERPTEPVSDSHRYVWNEDKGKLVKTGSLSDQGMGDLKNKFDASMQSNLGDMSTEEEIQSIIKPAIIEKKAITPSDISLLRIEMNKKKSEYLAAKRVYSEKVKCFNEEQEERNAKRKTRDVV